MSLIARQSLKFSILSYVGVVIGMLASIFLYPYDFAYMGYIRFLMGTATAIFPFIIMGTATSMVRFFPRFEDEKAQLNLLYTAILTIIVNAFVLMGIYLLWNTFFRPPYFINDIWINFPYIIGISFLMGLIQVGSKYISNYGRIAIPVVFDNIMPKVGLIISFCAFVFWQFSKTTATYIFIGIIFLAVLGLFFYLSRFQSLKLQNPLSLLKDKKFTQEFYAFSGFSLLGGIGTIVATQIDVVMIGEMLSEFSTGTYATLLSIVGLMFIPNYAINSISAPIVSNYIHDEKWHELSMLYKKVSENLFFMGSLLFCCMIAACPSLFQLMKNGEHLLAIFSVLYFLGGAALFDLATGINGQIISMSKLYKFNFWVTISLAFLTVILNYIFIKNFEMGVVGVATASCISLVLYNISKLLFIGIKFKQWPFTSNMWAISITLIVGILMAEYLPNASSTWINLFYKPALIIVLFLIANQIITLIPLQNFLSQDWKKTLMG